MSIKISVLTPSIRPEGLEITRKCLAEQTFKDFEWLVEIGYGKHDLNASYNRMLKRAKGELIVSLQDWIKVEPDYLEHFWAAYIEHPDTFWTSPVGKVKEKDFTGEIKWDWRNHNPENKMCGEISWDRWEIDSGAAPKKALFDIGGFDEELDNFWSSDNVNVGCRADLAGYKFRNLFSNPALAFDHDAFSEHPFRKDYKPIFNNIRMDEFREGLKINYLS